MSGVQHPWRLKGTLNAEVPAAAPSPGERATVTLEVTCESVDAMTVFDALTALMNDLRGEVTR